MAVSEEEVKALMEQMKGVLKQNEKILAENAELKTLMGGDNAGSARILRKVTNRTTEVRMVDGKVAIGYVNKGTDKSPSYWYEKPDPKDPRKMVDMVEVMFEDGKTLELQRSLFAKESQRVRCKVLKTDEKEWIENQGVVKKREVEEYSSIELDFDVPLDVIHKSYWFTVEVPKEFGGPREVRVGESMVNIG